jgi:hypothetical protein
MSLASRSRWARGLRAKRRSIALHRRHVPTRNPVLFGPLIRGVSHGQYVVWPGTGHGQRDADRGIDVGIGAHNLGFACGAAENGPFAASLGKGRLRLQCIIMSAEPQIPLRLGYAGPPSRRPSRPGALVGIAITAVVAGMFVGAATNAVNGAVSPIYFEIVMGWDSTGVWVQSVEQGVLEGFVIGIFLSFILTLAIGLITRASCTYGYALRWLAGVVGAVLGLWMMGGVAAVVWAAVSPGSYRNTFIREPLNFWQTVRFAWVGGTIWGAYVGGLLAVGIGLILFHLRWRRQLMRDTR